MNGPPEEHTDTGSDASTQGAPVGGSHDEQPAEQLAEQLADQFGVVESGRPDGPLVVLVHGALDRSSGMARLARRLGNEARVLRYDRRGYGRAVELPGPYGVARHARDLVHLLDGRRAVLVGHSFGSHVVLSVAADRPDLVSGVAVYEPPVSWAPWWTATRPVTPGDPGDAAEAFMRRMAGDRVWERLPAATRSARRAEGRAFVDEGADLRRGRPWDPARIACEVRVGCGERSGERFVRAAREVADVLGAALVTLPGADHGAHLSSAAEFADRLVLPLGALRVWSS